MMFVMLVAGIGLVLAGLLAIAYGIGIKFSIGNTLIIAGVIGVCTGAIMLGLWMAVRELKKIARRLGTGVPEARGEAAVRPVPPALRRGCRSRRWPLPAAEPFGGAGFSPAAPPAFSPRHRRHGRTRLYCVIIRFRNRCTPNRRRLETEAQFAVFIDVAKRARARPGADQRAAAAGSAVVGPSSRPPTVPPVETAEPPASFDDAWPRAERARPGEISPPRRSGRMPPTLAEANGGPALPEDQPEVTVLKSGVVDGMAYSLYSDGSIEAQMPEGMMRFASIDELRAHLDQRP